MLDPMDYGGYSPEDKKRARQLGLLQFGLALLGAPKGQELQSIGRAGLLGVAGYNQDLRDTAEERRLNVGTRRQEQLMAMQQAQMAEQARMAQGMEQARLGAITSAQPGMPEYGPPTQGGEMQPPVAAQPQGFDYAKYAQNLAPLMPEKALAMQQMFAPKSPESLFDKPKIGDVTPESRAKYLQTRNIADLVPVAKDAEEWETINRTPDGQIIQRNKLTGKLAAVGSPGQRVSVNLPPIESEEQKAIGKARGEAFTAYGQGARQAAGRIENLNAIEALVGNVPTGTLTPIGMKAAGVAKSLGLDVDPNLDRKQAAEAIANKLALDARSVAEGAGMPGAMSDKDREFLVNMNPNLAQTEGGRKMLIEIHKKIARRQQEMAALAMQYRAKTGSFDEGFQAVAEQYARERPMFDKYQRAASPAAPAAGGLTPAEKRELEQLRRRLGAR